MPTRKPNLGKHYEREDKPVFACIHHVLSGDQAASTRALELVLRQSYHDAGTAEHHEIQDGDVQGMMPREPRTYTNGVQEMRAKNPEAYYDGNHLIAREFARKTGLWPNRITASVIAAVRANPKGFYAAMRSAAASPSVTRPIRTILKSHDAEIESLRIVRGNNMEEVLGGLSGLVRQLEAQAADLPPDYHGRISRFYLDEGLANGKIEEYLRRLVRKAKEDVARGTVWSPEPTIENFRPFAGRDYVMMQEIGRTDDHRKLIQTELERRGFSEHAARKISWFFPLEAFRATFYHRHARRQP